MKEQDLKDHRSNCIHIGHKLAIFGSLTSRPLRCNHSSPFTMMLPQTIAEQRLGAATFANIHVIIAVAYKCNLALSIQPHIEHIIITNAHTFTINTFI